MTRRTARSFRDKNPVRAWTSISGCLNEMGREQCLVKKVVWGVSQLRCWTTHENSEKLVLSATAWPCHLALATVSFSKPYTRIVCTKKL